MVFRGRSIIKKIVRFGIMSFSKVMRRIRFLAKKNRRTNPCPKLSIKGASVRINRVPASLRLCSSSKKSLLYVDRAKDDKDFSFVHDFLRLDSGLVIFKTKIDYQKFHEDYNFEDIDERLFFIPGIVDGLDDRIYDAAYEFSSDFLRMASEAFSASSFGEGFADSLMSLNLSVMDRFQAWIRNALYLKEFIGEKGVDEFLLYNNGGSQVDLIALIVKSECGTNSKTVTKLPNIGSFTARQLIGKNWSLPVRSIVSKYDFSDLPNGPTLLFFGNLKDPLYRGTAEAVLEQLSAETECNVAVLQSDSFASEFQATQSYFLAPKIQVIADFWVKDFQSIFDSVCVEYLKLCGSDNDGGLLRLYSLSNSRRTLYKLFLDCLVLKRDVDDISDRIPIKGLVSNPGRLWMSQYLNFYLRHLPTFEIQSGTLSRTRRYRPPQSKYLLAVEDYSKAVYSEYLGVDEARITVVGAPRIDAKLMGVRSLPMEESRSVLGFSEFKEVICIATQPYGLQLMSDMVAEVAKVLSEKSGLALVVSMHPNESNEYENRYKKVLASQLAAGVAFLSRGNIYHCMNAANSVITYFSTSGLEAFCLKKRVFSYRPPGQSSVPFDLCELGVALPFSSGEELIQLLSENAAARPVTEGLQNLQDGQSVSRICKFIAERI